MNNQTFVPYRSELWAILNAGHIGFPKILEELVDNALSADALKIRIQLSQVSADHLLLTVHDSGCGFSAADLSRVFGVGYAPSAEKAGDHNQFGIGLKSVLASCDPENRDWVLYSCTEAGPCVKVSAAYNPSGMNYTLLPRQEMPRPTGWEAKGTCVTMPLSSTLFNTCSPRAVTNDDERIAALVEELRVTYAPLLMGKDVQLEWLSLGGKPKFFPLKPLAPQWDSGVVENEEKVDFGSGTLLARYAYGRIVPQKNASHYFKGNMTSSGLMIYLNGRLVQHNIYEQIWGQPHPQFNKFLFQVDLRTVDGNRDALPLPRPDKDQMIPSDPRFDAFLKWIRKLCPNPRSIVICPHEKEELAKCRELAGKLKSSGMARSVQLELPMAVKDGNTATRADVYALMADGRAVLYEAKVGGSKVQDVAQLAAYCLLATESGLQLDELVLVARNHSPEVHTFVSQLMNRWFRDLPVPVFRCITWADVSKGVL